MECWGDVTVQCPSTVANVLIKWLFDIDFCIVFFCYFPHCNVSFSWKASELGL